MLALGAALHRVRRRPGHDRGHDRGSRNAAPRPRASLRLPRESRDASRTAATPTDTRYGSCRISRRAPAPPWASHPPLRLGVRAGRAARDRDRTRGREHASGEAELDRRHKPRLTGLDHPRRRCPRLAAGNHHQRYLPPAHPTPTPNCARPRCRSAAAKRTGRDAADSCRSGVSGGRTRASCGQRTPEGRLRGDRRRSPAHGREVLEPVPCSRESESRVQVLATILPPARLN